MNSNSSPAPSQLRSKAVGILNELAEVDHAVYEAVARQDTPYLDEPLRRISNLANGSLIWLSIAAGLILFGGKTGRRAAVRGVASIGIASAVVNVGLKSIASRSRPNRLEMEVPVRRHVRMPESTSFPSGHSASGFAFATAVGYEIPAFSVPLRLLAASVAYSRVHTGVHYPGDAVVGALVGAASGQLVAWSSRRR